MLVTALTVLVGGFLLNYVIDGVYNDSFATAFVKILTTFHVEEQTAIDKVGEGADGEMGVLQQDSEQEKQKKKDLMQLLGRGSVRVKR